MKYMAKAVLVMDEMPEDCTMCKFWNSKDDECYATGAEELSLNSEEAKPDWCPLRELPEKMKVCGRYPQPDGITPSYKIGWNACLDEILK
jgi:hypothetical protein